MITIYYAYEQTDPAVTGLRTSPPRAVKNITGYDQVSSLGTGNYRFCPAYREHMKNLYALTAQFDYGLYLENDNVKTDYMDQDFFDQYVLIRSIESRLFSLKQFCIMIPDCDSLSISQSSAYLESNDFIESTTIIPGTFDIGKWPRPIECAFHMKSNRFDIKENDTMSYIKFHTDENIQFKSFYFTPLMKKYLEMLVDSKKNRGNQIAKSMSFFYDLISKKSGIKRKILEEAKKNCLE
jgi:hypothetical protein